jgi:hypothetical protein
MTVKLSVTEYGFDQLAIRPGNGSPVPVLIQPALVEQTQLSFTTASASAAFNAKTGFVALCADTVCYVQFGTSPTATVNSQRIPANTLVTFAVPIGQAYKVSGYDGSS